jgi:hypothetical protein
MFGLNAVGVDAGRHLLVVSHDTATVESLMTAPAHPFGRTERVAPLLTQLAAKHDQTATAAITVGSLACVPLAGIARNASPAALAALRKQFPGTFTRRGRSSRR